MKTIPVSEESLTDLFALEGLVSPGILPWPLSVQDEEERLRREINFSTGLGGSPPSGLKWIRSHLSTKYRPDCILTGCRSVLVTALGYYRNDAIDGGTPDGVRGRIARYARGRDYHKELKNRLKRIVRKLEVMLPGEKFRYFSDIGPLDETWLVQMTGLGFEGRHTLAILPQLGSWVVLGHIITTCPFRIPRTVENKHGGGCPDGCTRCIDACPVSALSFPGTLDASRCISYRTIEHQGPVDRKVLPEKIADRIFGCDTCQEVCPFNTLVKETSVEAFQRDIAGASLSLSELLSLKNRKDMLSRFAGSPLMRAGRDSLVRNACIAAGNSGNVMLIPKLLQLSHDPDAGVRLQASLALGKLNRLR